MPKATMAVREMVGSSHRAAAIGTPNTAPTNSLSVLLVMGCSTPDLLPEMAAYGRPVARDGGRNAPWNPLIEEKRS